MQHVQRKVYLPYAAEQVFALVDNVEAYPEFVPGCASVRVHERRDDAITATLTLRKAAMTAELTTQNERRAPHAMTMDLVSGPLKSLRAQWRFTALGELGCKVEFEAEFEGKGLLKRAMEQLISINLDQLVDAFVSRAHELLTPIKS